MNFLSIQLSIPTLGEVNSPESESGCGPPFPMNFTAMKSLLLVLLLAVISSTGMLTLEVQSFVEAQAH